MKSGSRHLLVTLTLTLALAMSLCMALALSLLAGIGLSARAAPADELHVCPSGCTYSSIQAAVDAAEPGDVIKVAEGVYTGVQNVPSLNTGTFTATQMVVITKSVTIRGGYTISDWTMPDPDANITTLDAQGQGRVLAIVGAGIAPTIEGLHITGGDSSGLGESVYGSDGGAGLFVLYASATISGNHIHGNTGYRGAGVWLQDCTATFRANEVRDNVADWAGAGLWLYRSPATLQGNHVVSNTAIYAAGIALHQSDATLRGNHVLSNTATSGEGGGVTIGSSKAILDGNVVLANRVNDNGGGVFISLSDATLTNNVIADNTANGRGSGLCVQGSSAHLIHNTIARNNGWGGGLYAASHFLGVDSHVMMTNTIVFSHTEGIIASEQNTVTLQATLWQANLTDWIGPGTVSHVNDHMGDPAFAPDGYHLTLGSAAINAGVGAGVKTDIDGEDRPRGTGYDIGADEFPLRNTYLPLVVRNR
jgi:hypothetical protein